MNTSSRLDAVLEELSAARDGELTSPEVPTQFVDEAQVFVAGMERLEELVELDRRTATPDVSGAVARRLQSSGAPAVNQPPVRSPLRRPVWRLVVPVFAAFALLGSALAGWPLGEQHTALAELADEVRASQGQIDSLDARVTVAEYGWHREVPARSFTGWLSFRSPETLRLSFEDTTRYPSTAADTGAALWIPNDVSFGIDRTESWSDGRLRCPVDLRPGCLSEQRISHRTVGRAPFDEQLRALDLVVPVGSVSGLDNLSEGVAVKRSGEIIDVVATVARFTAVFDALFTIGDWREYAPSDIATLHLDADSFELRGIEVRASDDPARSRWAAQSGYRDAPGALLLTVEIARAELPVDAHPSPPVEVTRVGAFVVGAAEQPSPAWLPEGMRRHLSGSQALNSPTKGGVGDVAVDSWSDGRAWVVIRSTTQWRASRLFGAFGSLVAPIETDVGTVFVDPLGTRVALHGADRDIEVTGSVGVDALVDIAASLGVPSVGLPGSWLQAATLDTLPASALRPASYTAARVDGLTSTIIVASSGAAGYRIVQRPGTVLAPPRSPDVEALVVRGVTGRFSPTRNAIEWVENGVVVELAGEGLPLEQLRDIAERLK